MPLGLITTLVYQTQNVIQSACKTMTINRKTKLFFINFIDLFVFLKYHKSDNIFKYFSYYYYFNQFLENVFHLFELLLRHYCSSVSNMRSCLRNHNRAI